MANEYERLISADSHIFEDVDLWSNALGDKYGDHIPHRVPEFNGKKATTFTRAATTRCWAAPTRSTAARTS